MKCHACGEVLLPPVLQLGNIPLVDKYLKDQDLAKKVESSPLSLCQCVSCRTYQIEEIVDPKILYSEYIYSSFSSPDLHKHFEQYADYVNKLVKSHKKSKILEIGGNDGLLLNKLYNLGLEDLSVIDPAPQVLSCQKFSKVFNEYFGSKRSEDLLISEDKYDLIIANNCLAHIPNLKGTFELISKIIQPDGYLIFEVNSLYHMIINDVFDYIYHEHIFYHSVTSLEKLLGLSSIYINDLLIVPTKGGSLRVKCSLNPGESPSVKYWKMKERSIGLHLNSPDIFKSLNSYIPFLRESLFSLLSNLKYKNLYAFGASATSTVLINSLNIGGYLTGIIDDNKERQGRYSPALGLPVNSTKILEEEDLVVNLAWRHHSSIMRSLSKSKIKKVINPIPFPKIEKI